MVPVGLQQVHVDIGFFELMDDVDERLSSVELSAEAFRRADRSTSRVSIGP